MNREDCGCELLKLIEMFSEGFVIAINGRWGSGKTTFVEMWEQQIKNEGYITLHYNAWENDYNSDPMVGLIAELKKFTELPGNKHLKKLINGFRKIVEAAVPNLLALATGDQIGIGWGKVVKHSSKAVIELLNNCVDNQIEYRKSINKFREALKEYVQDVSSDKPIVFIIDELDRCKPDFAVNTLERIKHLFNVENIVFVLAIDRVQLSNSVRGYYGSDTIDGDDYLRRFIDIQYELPPLNVGTMIRNILNRFDFSDDLFNTKDEFDRLLNFVGRMSYSNNLSIRQIEKWMIQTRLVFNNMYHQYRVPVETISFITFLINFDADLFDQLVHLDTSDQDILFRIYRYFSHSIFYIGNPSQKKSQNNERIYEIIAEMFKMRFMGLDQEFNERIIDKDGRLILKMNYKSSEKQLLSAFKRIKNGPAFALGMIRFVISDLSNIDY